MDENILEETAREEMFAEIAADVEEQAALSAVYDDDEFEEDEWDAWERRDLQSDYDDEWGDPLDMPSYGM